MPKLRQLESQYNERDFLKEINARCAWHELNTCEALAKKIGVSAMTAYNYKTDPSKIRMDTMQKIVKTLEPDIRITLKYLGYTDKQIKQFAKEITA